MQILKSSSFSSTSRFLHPPLNPNSFVFLLYYSSSTLVPDFPLLKYLIKDLDFSQTLALTISNRHSNGKWLMKAQSVAKYFQSLCCSNAHIASIVRYAPRILFADVETNLRPKIKLFQDLGLDETNLGKFLSRNSAILTCSLDKKLIPSIKMLKKVLGNGDDNDKDLIHVLNRCNGFIVMDSMSKLMRNIKYLESHGIVGSQLSRLLTRQPRIFRMNEFAMKELVSRVLDMGISTDSRMLVHYILTLNCLSEKTFRKKCELFKSFGFTEKDCAEIFRRAPAVFRTSEEKIMLRMDFFMNVVNFDRNVLVSRPCVLAFSLEDRVIPRYKVLQIIKSKNLLKKERSFLYILELTEDRFLKFMSRFTNNLEELLIAYKGHLVDTFSVEKPDGNQMLLLFL